jgi:hypothetical protein
MVLIFAVALLDWNSAGLLAASRYLIGLPLFLVGFGITVCGYFNLGLGNTYCGPTAWCVMGCIVTAATRNMPPRSWAWWAWRSAPIPG